MRSLLFAGILMTAVLLGCASPGIDEVRLKQFEMELKAEFRDQIEATRQELSRKINKENQGLKSEIKSEVRSIREGSQTDMSEIRTVHKEDDIDLQKQIFGNKRLIEDQAKRIYLIESIVTAKASASTQVEEEGFVTSVDGVNISISLGSGDNIRPGDVFDIYKGDEKIASGKAIKVDANSSDAIVISKEAEISLGDSVRPEKE